jgi:adenylate cyclase
LTEARGTRAGAIAFTDIVGFTEFTAVQGDAEAIALLDRQEQLVRAALPSGARIVKELGDGLLLWLPEAYPALVAALDLLDRFGEAAQPTALWVRIGMHWGAPTPRGDDIVGHDVNLAARIVDVAGPGELLMSDTVRTALDAASAAALRFDELGPVVMRGIPEPVRLYRASRSPKAPSRGSARVDHPNVR